MRRWAWFRHNDDKATLGVTLNNIQQAPPMQAIEEALLQCPHCGESISLLLDLTGGTQSYVEDCQVCCQPIQVNLWIDPDEDDYHVDLRREQD